MDQTTGRHPAQFASPGLMLLRKAFPGQHDTESDTVQIVLSSTDDIDRTSVWNIVRTNRMSPILAAAVWRAAAPYGQIGATELVPFLHPPQFAAYKELADAGIFS